MLRNITVVNTTGGNLEMWNFATPWFIASLSEIDSGTLHLITFPLSYKVWGNPCSIRRMNWPKGQLLQRLTLTTAGIQIGAALSNVRPKPWANTEHTESFFSVSLEKVSSSPGWPNVGWRLMVSEPAGWDETSGDKYQYHFSMVIAGSGAFFRTTSLPAFPSFC